jgi:hypothetical protein
MRATSIADLLASGELERVPVDAAVCEHLLEQAANHLRTAAAGLAGADPEGAFQLAYDANRKAALAFLLATGLRPKGQGAHATTFEAARQLAPHRLPQALRDAGNLRFVRNNAEYRAEHVDLGDVQDAIDSGVALTTGLGPIVARALAKARTAGS